MNYATSLAKSTYKGTKSMVKSVVSYVVPTDNPNSNPNIDNKNDEKEYSWLSCIIFFRTPYGKYIVDQGCIILGNVPTGYHGLFTNFTNWTVKEDHIFYNKEILDPSTGNGHSMLEIDPSNVYLHIRVGDSNLEKSEIVKNISNYEYYVPTHTNRMYKFIADQLIYPKVKIFDLTGDYGSLSTDSLKERISKIFDPRFMSYKHQIYGKDLENLMYNGINLNVL